MAISLSLDEAKRMIEAVEQALKEGYAPEGHTVKKGERGAIAMAAIRLGMNRQTLDGRLRPDAIIARVYKLRVDWSLWKRPEVEPVAQVEKPEQPQVRKEIQDAQFWRAKFKAVERELVELENLAEQLGGLSGIPLTIPEYFAADAATPKKSVMGCLVSDIHMGEVIKGGEILGINEFNPDICRARLRRYFSAACSIGERWASDTDCQGVLLALGGDLVSGDIHEELRMTNALTSHEQVQAVVEEVVAGILELKQTFGKVHAVGVPGNHGRSTVKPTAKMYSRLSYDMLCVAMIHRHFLNDPEVTFQASEAKDQIVPIFGRSVFVTHGDKIGTKGGMGFAGPLLPIVRGTKKIEAQQASIGRRPDLILHGHYHLSANPGNGVLSNGSVPGYSEFADDLRAVVEPPQQWIFLLQQKWGLRERLPVLLADPDVPAKPKVRVPVEFRRT